MQETTELFKEIETLFFGLADEPLSANKAKVMDLLLECDVVELVQEMWRQYSSQDLLTQEEDLPSHIHASLGVMHISHLYFRHQSILDRRFE